MQRNHPADAATFSRRWLLYRADITLFLVLLAAAVKYTSGVSHAVDIQFYDESLYLLAGVKLYARGFYCPECGPLFAPLYNAWYFLLSFLTHDNLRLYWLNYKILTIIPTLLTYVLLRRNNVSYLVSAAISVIVLTSASNIPVWPKVANFGVSVTLLFLILASGARSVPRALLLGALGAFLTAYARPEYFLTSALLFVLLAGGMTLKREWRAGQHVIALGGTILVMASLVAVVGMPVSAYRSLCAFGQHFALHWVSWTSSALNPWDDWQLILAQNFGQPQGMADLVRNNPYLLMKHIGENVIGLVSNFHMLFPTYLFGDKISKLAIVAIVGWVFYVRRDVVRKNLARQGTYMAIVGLFIITGLIAIVMIYPRPHYFVFPVTLGMSSLALLLSGQKEPRKALAGKQVVLFALLILAVTPPPYVRVGDEAQENLRTIRLVQDMHITRQVNVLDAEGGIEAYLGNNFQSIDQSEKDTRFREFIASRKIGMVVLTHQLATDVRFRGDPEWKDFRQHSDMWGFSRIRVPDSETELFVLKDLLSPH